MLAAQDACWLSRDFFHPYFTCFVFVNSPNVGGDEQLYPRIYCMITQQYTLSMSIEQQSELCVGLYNCFSAWKDFPHSLLGVQN